jgi:hypothetical protein
MTSPLTTTVDEFKCPDDIINLELTDEIKQEQAVDTFLFRFFQFKICNCSTESQVCKQDNRVTCHIRKLETDERKV